jgi:transcriptional regulator with XRE-family HTH domain
MDLKRKFGIRLRAIRKEAGLTQDELAASIGRSVDAISNIERGKSLPSFEMVLEFSRALNLELSVLFDLDGPTRSHRQVMLLERLAAVAITLDEVDLEIAVEQVEVIARRKRPPPSHG